MVNENREDIDDIKSLLSQIGLSKGKSQKYAEALVLTHKVDSVTKFQRKVGSDIAGYSATLQLDTDDVELLEEYFKQPMNVSTPPPLSSPSTTANSSSASAVGGAATTTPTHWTCFMTHNWGIGNENHLKVKRINDALKTRGVIPWFDEERMSGDTRLKMVEGIENSDVIVVFITEAYRNKINQGDSRDNCRFEFKHAFEQKGAEFMIPVVMESGMRNARDWTGLLGAALSAHLYIDFSSAFTDDATFDAKVNELVSSIGALLP